MYVFPSTMALERGCPLGGTPLCGYGVLSSGGLDLVDMLDLTECIDCALIGIGLRPCLTADWGVWGITSFGRVPLGVGLGALGVGMFESIDLADVAELTFAVCRAESVET